ncbi:MAG: hypothetical protein AAGE89_07590 [Pseudomonadota bacterium]
MTIFISPDTSAAFAVQTQLAATSVSAATPTVPGVAEPEPLNSEPTGVSAIYTPPGTLPPTLDGTGQLIDRSV